MNHSKNNRDNHLYLYTFLIKIEQQNVEAKKQNHLYIYKGKKKVWQLDNQHIIEPCATLLGGQYAMALDVQNSTHCDATLNFNSPQTLVFPLINPAKIIQFPAHGINF